MCITAKPERPDNLNFFGGYSGSPGVLSSDPPKVTSGSRITFLQCKHRFSLVPRHVASRIEASTNNEHPRRPKKAGGSASFVQGDRSKEVELGAACEQLLALYMHVTVLWC